jgi:drug/metabolite transporter (DMT)-like permease
MLFFTALQTTTVASAAVISALQPVMLLPVSSSLYGERVTARRLSLIVPTVLGTVLVVAGSSGGGEWSLGGDLAALAGTALGCVYFVGTKSARDTLDTLEYQAAALVVAAVTALPGAVLLGDGFVVPGGTEWLWPVVMTLVPGTGHLLMSWAQRSLSVSFTATVALAVVVVSSVGAAVLFDQPLSAVQVVGMAVVLGSLARFVRDSVERVDPVAEEL